MFSKWLNTSISYRDYMTLIVRVHYYVRVVSFPLLMFSPSIQDYLLEILLLTNYDIVLKRFEDLTHPNAKCIEVKGVLVE